MLILKTLALEPMHGYGIGVRLDEISRGVFQVNAGSLFPALRRLERDGLIKGSGARPRATAAPSTTPHGVGPRALKRETEGWEVQAIGDRQDPPRVAGRTVMAICAALLAGLVALVRRRASRTGARRRAARLFRGVSRGSDARRYDARGSDSCEPPGDRQPGSGEGPHPRCRLGVDLRGCWRDVALCHPRVAQGAGVLRRDRRRWRSASAPTPRSSASSTRSCCVRCRSSGRTTCVSLAADGPRGVERRSHAAYRRFADEGSALAAAVATSSASGTLCRSTPPEPVDLKWVSGQLLHGARRAGGAGRTLLPSDDQLPPAAAAVAS